MSDLPYLTADLPGLGGVLKATPGDFVVEEIPAYRPCGEGEHLFLWIEKEDVAADALLRHLGRSLGMPRDEIGVSGLKDKRAVTRQFVSVPARFEDRVPAANTSAIRVLSAVRHTNKLKTGHLRGNRFSILLRQRVPSSAETTSPAEFRSPSGEVLGCRHVPSTSDGDCPIATNSPDEEKPREQWDDGRLARAESIAERLRADGVPNYFGEQRFGIGGETTALGFALLRGEKTAKDIPPAKRKFLLRLALSAAQSDLFNLALADRLRRVELRTVLAGDVMRKSATGGLFVAEDVPVEQARLDAGETQVTGPLFGPKMPQPKDEPAAREAALLAVANLPSDAFSRYPKLTAGTRRPYLISVPDLSVTPDPNGLRFTFSLPAGAYATVVMREVMKAEAVSP